MADDKSILIEQGTHGLFYATDRTSAGVFIVAQSAAQAKVLAKAARKCLVSGRNEVANHTLHDHANGARMTIPNPELLTFDQRKETIERMHRHVTHRLLT